jgi:predicted nucleic acid-binding protein
VTPVVVDSSVAIKWFVPEVLSEEATRLLDGSFELLAPDLLIAECGNVLWKKVTRNELGPEDGRAILQGLIRAPVRMVGSQALAEAALEVAIAFRRSVYDGMYVALAAAHDCVLVTADDRLARALAGGPLGGNVRALSEWAAS